MINIVIPMAGMGKRFVDAGFDKPKPFIDVMGKPMIQHVLENLSIPDAQFILIARREHCEQNQDIVNDLSRKFPIKIIKIEKLTEGSVCTVLFAKKFIDNKNPLLIANSDQIVDFNIKDFVRDAQERKLDGSILTFIDTEKSSKWSFAKINKKKLVIEVQEKKPISEFATVGIYYYSKGTYFIDASIEMIINNERVNNEFYTCPTYNYLIANKKKIGIYNIDAKDMHGTGTPDDLKVFIRNRKIIC